MTERTLKMVAWNANGLNGRIHKLEMIAEMESPDVLMVSETTLHH